MNNAIAFKTVYLPNNQGHGNARRESLENCSHDFVALMDSDDLSLPWRFERQMRIFYDDTDLDIVGGQISEFIDLPENITDRRLVPLYDGDIKKYMKKRCPMNQVSVMFKKSFAEQVGGYIDWYCEEDYYLWIRMALGGGKFANTRDTLVNVRVGEEMSSRRGGWKYFKSEAKLQKYMLRKKVIGFPRYLYNIAIRFGGEVLAPNKLREKLFRLLRSKKADDKREDHDFDKKDENCEEKNVLKNENEMHNENNDNGNNNERHGVDKKIVSKKYPPFSVAMCVYSGDNAEWFDTALGSVINQTLPPDEIVLVVDGPIPQTIQDVIDKYNRICCGGGV